MSSLKKSIPYTNVSGDEYISRTSSLEQQDAQGSKPSKEYVSQRDQTIESDRLLFSSS